MNEEWWYEIHNQQLGPITIDELRNLRQIGKISNTTLVWQRNFDNWRPLAEVIPAATAVGPPPLPSRPIDGTTPAQSELSPATPIRRFFARYVDLLFLATLLFIPTTLLFALISMLFDWIGGYVPSGWVYRTYSFFLGPLIWSSFFKGIFICMLLLVAESLVFSIFRTTPGKLLLGIHVHDSNGQQPTSKAYFHRLCGLFLYGLGLGITSFPLVMLTLIAMFMQYLRLTDGRPTRYDEGKFIVLATTRLADQRIFLTILLIVALHLAWIPLHYIF